jgi:GNAT superfamily N-acetyltransferase
MPARRKRAAATSPLKDVEITTAPHSWPSVHVVQAHLHGREVGYMELEEVEGPRDQRLLKVAFVEVRRKGVGIGTKLYEKAAAFACKLKRPLASDDARTSAAQGFWLKQARKGRATCLRGSGRATALTKGYAEKGLWACGQYALTCPAPKSLAAARRAR